MGPPNESPKNVPEGFEGSVAGLGLADVVELNAHNRFSGLVSVECDVSTGLVFFRDGEVVHAEPDGQYGEQAFYEIMQWPRGRFTLQPNVATTRRTIDRSWKFLLMEAHRIMDERRAGRAAGPPAEKAAPPRGDRPAQITERIRRIPGVAHALLLAKDGGRLADDTYQGEMLEGQTVYLSMLGRRLGEIFQAGEVLAAAVQGTERHLLLLAARHHYLSVLVEGTSQPGAVEAEIRKLLAPGR